MKTLRHLFWVIFATSLIAPSAVAVNGAERPIALGPKCNSAACAPIFMEGKAPEKIVSVDVMLSKSPDHVGTKGTPLFYVKNAHVGIRGRNFTVRLDPESVPDAYKQRGGQVDATAFIEGRTKSWETSLSVAATPQILSASLRSGNANPARGWFRASEKAPLSDASLQIKGANVKQYPGAPKVKTSDFASLGRTVQSNKVKASLAPIRITVDPGCRDSATGVRRQRPAAIGSTYALGKNKGSMTIANGAQGEYGIAIKAVGAKGSFSSSGTRTSSSSWKFAWAPKRGAREYRTFVQYKQMKRHCWNGLGFTTRRYLRWVPVKETGGVTERKIKKRPNWKKCTPALSRGTWSRDKEKGRKYENNVGVLFKEVIGINLTSKRSYSRSKRIDYHFNKSKGRFDLCGKDAYPADASQIMMKKRPKK